MRPKRDVRFREDIFPNPHVAFWPPTALLNDEPFEYPGVGMRAAFRLQAGFQGALANREHVADPTIREVSV